MGQTTTAGREKQLTLEDFRWANRRKEERHPVGKTVRVFTTEDKSRDALLADCSPHGVCIEMPHPIQADAQFLIQLKTDRLRMVAYTVRWWWKMPEGQYRIGAELTGIIGSSDEADAGSVFRALLDAAGEPDQTAG